MRIAFGLFRAFLMKHQDRPSGAAIRTWAIAAAAEVPGASGPSGQAFRRPGGGRYDSGTKD